MDPHSTYMLLRVSYDQLSEITGLCKGRVFGAFGEGGEELGGGGAGATVKSAN